jgi:D-beta-D-heptose 7-phosphate kinase/D-beta-D-heptose 1-phosphate adenosyltransferase
VKGPLVIVGDTLLDRDVRGTVSRLCPDAPVPVLDELASTDRPGGAGLAAVLAAAGRAAVGGREVVLVTGIAGDAAGATLSTLLARAGVQVFPLRLPGATPEKIRLRSGRRTLLRLDRGGGEAPPDAPSEATLAVFGAADAILVSDYGHGLAALPALRDALRMTKAPIVWDPHPHGAAAVAGVQLVTPNEGEVLRLCGDAVGGPRLAAVSRAASTLCGRWRSFAVAVTLGADGALVCPAGATPLMINVAAGDSPEVDACGAGDRFAVSAAAALADGALVSEAVQRAVQEASGFVLAGGLDRVHPDDDRAQRGDRTHWDEHGEQGEQDAATVVAGVRAAGGTVVATGGCFDILHTGHLSTLRAARGLGDCLIVCLNSDRGVTRLKGPDRPVTTQRDRARLLCALDCVDAVVVFDEPTPHAVLSRLRPDIWVKGADYEGVSDLPEAELVARWGGQTILVPYLPGRSTTATIAAARSGVAL